MDMHKAVGNTDVHNAIGNIDMYKLFETLLQNTNKQPKATTKIEIKDFGILIR